MTGGITPIDNGLELIGLHQCSALLRFIFIETLAGKAIFILGFILSMARSLKDANFRGLIIYCAIFFSFLILVVIPKSAIRIRVSTMEERGYTGIKTADILRKAGVEPLTVSPVLDVLARTVAGFSSGAIGVIDRLQAHRTGFLKSPFATAKLWLLTRESIGAGITDPGLKEKTIRFYQDHYFLALRAVKDSHAAQKNVVWPGAGNMLSLYSSEGASAWRGLCDELYSFINREGVFDELSKDYYAGVSIKEVSVHALIDADVAQSPLVYTALSFSGQEGAVRGQMLAAGIRARDFLEKISRACFSGFPFVYGLCLWALWALFPFVLVLLFLSADMAVLAGFLKCLLTVKLLPVVWALADRTSLLVFDIHTALVTGKVFLWDMPLVGLVVLAGMGVSVAAFIYVVGQSTRKGSV